MSELCPCRAFGQEDPSMRQLYYQLPRFSYSLTHYFFRKSIYSCPFLKSELQPLFLIPLPWFVFITALLMKSTLPGYVHTDFSFLDLLSEGNCMDVAFICFLHCCVLPWDSSQCLCAKLSFNNCQSKFPLLLSAFLLH